MKIVITNKFYFLLLISIILLQSFRNVSSIGYTFILIISYILFFTHFKYKKPTSNFINLGFLFFYILFPLISLVSMPLNEFGIAIVRYCALMPIAIFGLLYPNYIRENMYSILKIFCTIVFFSSLLLIYQTFFGTIEIFGEVSERMGYIRYTSLLGSTTAYGTFAPLAILVINIYKDMYSRKNSFIFQIIIIIGGIICLSKSFYINILIIFFFILIDFKYHKKVRIKTILMILITILIGIIIFLFLIDYTSIGDYFRNMINYTFNSRYNGIDTDLIDRLTNLPRIAFNYHEINIFSLLFGVGFKGYSGILGLPSYPMCHNNYFDIILSQGTIFFLIIIFIYFKTLIMTLKENSNNNKFIKILIIYILFNMLAGQWCYLVTIPMIFLLLIISSLNSTSNTK